MIRLPIVLTILNCVLAAKLDVIYEWKYIDYLWDSEEQKSTAISEHRYNHTLIFAIDVQKVKDGRVFMTTPAFNPNAVPATLSTVSRRKGSGGPLLKPYPNWKWHNSTNCTGITSVWRVAVDDCERLWVLDSGKIGEDQVCQAQLLMFDIQTDALRQRIQIPNDVSHNPQKKALGLLISPAVETEGINCERTWVYMADTEGGGLIVYDGSYIWRINNEVFNPVPAESDFSLAGVNFSVPDGIFGLAVTPVGTSPSPRRLYFRPLASLKEYYISIGDLHRSRTANENISYTTLNYRLPSQATAQAFSRDGILFFGLTKEIAIACWNINNAMDDKRVVIVSQDYETLQWASGVKVTRSSDNQFREQLWVLTNRLQKIWTGTQNFDEINFRILSASVDELVNGSECRLQRRKPPSLINMIRSLSI